MNNETSPQETQNFFHFDREIFYKRFSVPNMEELARYQEQVVADGGLPRLVMAPISEDFRKTFPDSFHLLTETLDRYEDVALVVNGEKVMCIDLIYDDDIIIQLTQARKALESGMSLLNEQKIKGQIKEYGDAIGVRANVLGYLFSNSPFSPREKVAKPTPYDVEDKTGTDS